MTPDETDDVQREDLLRWYLAWGAHGDFSERDESWDRTLAVIRELPEVER